MWKQFFDKWKQLFESDDQELTEDESGEEKREPYTYRSSEAKSKMTYHYPKTGSFRFPAIPDYPVSKRPSREDVPETSGKEDPYKKRERKEKTQPDYRTNRTGDQAEHSTQKKRPIPSEEPFIPTVVPSPIYGFQYQKAYEKENEESFPEPEVQLPSWKERNEPIIPEEKQEKARNQEESEPVELPQETETEEDIEPTVYEAQPEEDIEPAAYETPTEDEERVPAEEYYSSSYEEEEKNREPVVSVEEAPQVIKEEDSTRMETEAVSETPSAEKEAVPHRKTDSKKKSSVPFNVIMTPRDKRSRDKSRQPEPTPVHSEKKDREEDTEIPREEAEETPLQKNVVRAEYQLPLHLFNDRVVEEEDEDHILREQMEQLETTLQQFQVKAKVTDAMKGPAVTRFEVQPEPGVKVNKITNLSDDIKLGMAAKDIRMEAPIPGKQAVGIEVPNHKSQIVGLQEIFETDYFKKSASPLTVGLGLDIAGVPSVTDLKDMPHGLIAGATGSGKSVCINTILLSLLYKSHYEDVKFLLIDPKMVELAPYNGLPHLVSPVITDVKAATNALKWAVQEMEERYEKFVEYGVRDVEKFNEKVKREGEGKAHEKLPYLVIVIDELADLMMSSPQDVEDAICKIAQKARACGIHLLVATQRPSVDVITGLIKANIPTRIAFSVSSQADSRTVLDSGGAEKLLGKGDMLFMGNGERMPKRIQGAFVSDDEINRVTSHMRNIAPANYLFEQEELLKQVSAEEEEKDVLFDEAVQFVLTQNGASASLIQRRFRVGYNRAARLIDQMEQHGIISAQKGSKPRDVLLNEQQLEEWRQGETS